MTSDWLSFVVPFGIGIWVACGVASGLYFLRRQLHMTEQRIIFVIGLGSMMLAYSIVFQEKVGAHLGEAAVVATTLISLGIMLTGAVLWLKSSATRRS